MDKPNMTDEEIAEYFEQRRGDVSGWRRVEVPRKSQRGRSTSVFSVRLTHEELQTVQAAADERGQYVSTFIRDAALDAAKGARSMAPIVYGTVAAQNLDSAIRTALRSVA